MPWKRVRIIFNPIANFGRSWAIASSLRPLLTELGGAEWTGTVYPTHAVELARQAGADGVEIIIAMGGDGTVHEIVNGLMQLPPEKRPILAIVPVGTGNDFAHSLGVSSDPEIALRQAFSAPAHAVDIAHIRDNRGHEEYWVNSLGIGFDAVINIRSRRIPVFQGFLVYFLALLQAVLLDYTPYRARFCTEREEWEETLLMTILGNGKREGGGFQVAPRASVRDGVIDFCTVRTIPRMMMFYTIPFFLKGTQGDLSYVRSGQLRRLELHSDRPLFIHTDGEIYAAYHSTVRDLTVESVPSAIRVVAPALEG